MPTPTATWTTPPDWSTAYVVLADDLDTYLSSNELYLYTYGGRSVGCRAYSNSSVSVPNASTTAIALNSERYDTDNMHSTVSSTSRIVVPFTGVYLITASISYASNGTGQRAIQLWVNSANPIIATTFVNTTTGSLTTDIAVATVYRLTAGDYVEMAAYQNSGGALNIVAGGNYSPELTVTLLRG